MDKLILAISVLLVICLGIIIGILFNPREFYSYPYTPDKFNCNIDKAKETEGLKYFKTKKLIICSLLRDTVWMIDSVKKHCERLGSEFADYAVVIVENDSSDGTRDKLIQWADNNKRVHILGCQQVNQRECHLQMRRTIDHDKAVWRIQKMVNLRNIYMNYIASNSVLSKYDYILMWDMDIDGEYYLDGVGTTGYYFKKEA